MNRIDLFLLTQAFASATDMASSSVRENIILTITPTLDGVCRMLLYIILNFVVWPKWIITMILCVFNQLLMF